MKKNAFTLIESLVVMTMIMVLTAIAITSYAAASKKTRDNRRKADLDKVRMALEMFRQNDLGGSYPASASSLVPDYLDVWPVGPKGADAGDTYNYDRTPSDYAYLLETNMELETTGVGYSVANP